MTMQYDADKVERRGLMFVLSSPSGAGKTTLADRLLKGDARIQLAFVFGESERQVVQERVLYRERS